MECPPQITWIVDLSRQAHNRVFADTDESLCSRAWRLRGGSIFWAAWVLLFRPAHCQDAHQFHHHIRRLRHAVPPQDCPEYRRP
jgi:hypothetical protein